MIAQMLLCGFWFLLLLLSPLTFAKASSLPALAEHVQRMSNHAPCVNTEKGHLMMSFCDLLFRGPSPVPFYFIRLGHPGLATASAHPPRSVALFSRTNNT